MSDTQQGAQSRACAAQAVMQVLEEGQSLSQALPAVNRQLSSRDRAMTQALCFAVMRQLPLLNFVVSQLLEKPLKGQLKILHSLLLVGACQILVLKTSPHAAVAATVEAATLLGRQRQKGLVNGVLRNLLRRETELLAQAATRKDVSSSHPRWLAEKLKAAYPQQFQDVFDQNNAAGPMWLRVNQSRIATAEYLAKLSHAGLDAKTADVPSALLLEHPTDVNSLPGFADGLVSVQDIAAQRAAFLLDAQPGQRVLDCCAAPGGKTAHILEHTQGLSEVIALDNDSTRLKRVYENLERLQLSAKVICADAGEPKTWWDEQPFDRILLDAPCSATGVIRRHPDIKWLRRESDIATLSAIQAHLLQQLWPLLAPGGTLLYATCSILPDENRQQIERFVADQPDCQWVALPPAPEAPGASDKATPGWQLLPGDFGGDGFYYAKLVKMDKRA